MNSAILGKNLIIQKQIEEISEKFACRGIKSLLLKGAALVSAFPAYAKTRNMEDIDILVPPNSVSAARKILTELGYKPFPEDPCAMKAANLATAVDLAGNIWYLDDTECEAVFNSSLNFSECGFHCGMCYLKPEDFYIHVLAHGAFQHAEINTVWRQDLALIMENWGKTIDWDEVEGKLKKYGFQKASNTYLFPETGRNSFYHKLLLSKENPLKGHVARFIFLPLRKKINYIFRAMFPSKDFLQNRYRIDGPVRVFFYRLARPFLLLKNLVQFAVRLLVKPSNL